MTPWLEDTDVTVYHGDCLHVMAEMDEASVDAVVCDPPYGLEFMGKEWDRFRSDDTGTSRHRGELVGRQGTTGGNDRWSSDGGRSIPSRRTAFGGGKRPTTFRCDGCGKRDQFRNEHGCTGARWRAEIIDPYAAPPTMLAFQNWCREWGREALRVLKPGGHLLAFGGTRTSHRLVCGLEDAGFEIRDALVWLYGSGFPKSLSPYRAIIRELCQSLESAPHAVVISPHTQANSSAEKGPTVPALVEIHPEGALGLLMPTGAADGSCAAMVIGPSALQMVGMNLSIEPSWQHTSAVLLNGTSTSITETVIRATTAWTTSRYSQSLPTPPTITSAASRPDGCSCGVLAVAESSSAGRLRWSATPLRIAAGSVTGPVSQLRGLGTAAKPAHEPVVVARKPLTGTVAGNVPAHGTGALNIDACRIEGIARHPGTTPPSDGGRDTMSGDLPRVEYEPSVGGRWPANVVLDEQAAAMLDAQTGDVGAHGGHVSYVQHAWLRNVTSQEIQRDDRGGASRFFYTAKADSQERRGSKHPTVKPLALMRWLVRLVTPPGGLVLDPFAGSGTTLEAARAEGFRAVGIEREAEYLPDIAARLAQLSLLGGAA